MIKRYELDVYGSDVQEDENGPWVLYASHIAETAALREQVKQFGDALQIIVDWPFRIQGDCVADARALAFRVLNKEAKPKQGALDIED